MPLPSLRSPSTRCSLHICWAMARWGSADARSPARCRSGGVYRGASTSKGPCSAGDLFVEIGLPKTRKTKQGYSTDAQSIEGLRGVHPIIDTILRWREMTKLRSTYIETLPGAVAPKDLRIHTTFDQAVAATGRLS